MKENSSRKARKREKRKLGKKQKEFLIAPDFFHTFKKISKMNFVFGANLLDSGGGVKEFSQKSKSLGMQVKIWTFFIIRSN